MTRVVVAIDPAVTSGEEADETGIVVAGKDKDGHGYVLADISGRYPPTEWARLAITAYATHGADRMADVVEASWASRLLASKNKTAVLHRCRTDYTAVFRDAPQFPYNIRRIVQCLK